MANINPIRYRGYYYDSEIGMYYLQSRYYDQSIGRFINADDAGLVELLTESSLLGANIFTYCENNGVMNVDPSGYWATKGSDFKWKNNRKSFIVKTSTKFLSRAYCLSFATCIVSKYGKKSNWYSPKKYAGLTATQIAAECFAHAILYYFSNITKKLFNRGYNWNTSAKEINVDKGDYRQWQFTAIWVAFSVTKKIPWVKTLIISRIGYFGWLTM